ncbi:(Fe-S)-binding protein [candidate division CSSED10-310 bacterium]|uniref:(Fe-S)-binding protein n=1 Tax=candidate division CSSED10-310 bacterium TaxID=2855610 RepID=A0ABV6YXN5_UNCC1
MTSKVKIADIGKKEGQLTELDLQKSIPLPPPYDKFEDQPKIPAIKEETKQNLVCNLDGVIALAIPQPKSKEEEQEYVEKFVSGLHKMLSKENNWTFLQPLLLSLEYCAKCQTCSEACPVFTASGENEIYRPTYRSEVWRRLVKKYARPGNKLLKKLKYGDIDLNWNTITRLYELSYRCTMCRRCAQTCPMGVDNGLITHELRKLFSQELGWAPRELHESGTVLQLKVGSSTGMNPLVVKDNMEFVEEDFEELTGLDVKIPWDKEEADILLIHNAGEIMAWPENPAAFAIILNAAGISWTLSSEEPSYDGVNYGLFYDDFQLARIALKHAATAKKLKVKKIVMGECGHQHKAMMTISDRILLGDMNIHKESCLPLLEEIVFSGKIKFDPQKNNFPVTLHDPCNITRNLGIIEPQRRIMKYLCPQFREMTPHGVDNYCCGGGSGFAIMSGNNFAEWRTAISGRRKFKQILDAFSDCLDPEINKYVCAPCSNCKGQMRDILEHYGATEKSSIIYGGLVELIVNAMVDTKESFIEWE